MVATRLTALFCTLMAPAMVGTETLTLYHWPDYMPEAILEDFTRETGHNVRVIAYESDELKTDTLISTGGEGFDMMVSSGYTTYSYLKQGWIAKLDETLHPLSSTVASDGEMSFPISGSMPYPTCGAPSGSHAFLDYLYRPDVSARISNELMFATTNDEARPLQPVAIRENKAIYPHPETLSRSEVIKPFSD